MENDWVSSTSTIISCVDIDRTLVLFCWHTPEPSAKFVNKLRFSRRVVCAAEWHCFVFKRQQNTGCNLHIMVKWRRMWNAHLDSFEHREFRIINIVFSCKLSYLSINVKNYYEQVHMILLSSRKTKRCALNMRCTKCYAKLTEKYTDSVNYK